jgi:hypothetical protein
MRFSSRSITCPRCALTSYHPEDVRQLYCGYCHWWTSDPVLGMLMVDGGHRSGCDRPQCIGCRVGGILPS